MPFPRPIAIQRLGERDTTRVRFDDETVGEYYLRGGIAWPTVDVDKTRGQVRGYAVLVGVNVRTDRACVFESTPFNMISSEVALREGAFAGQPLGPWLNRCWASWYADTFYWHDHGETHTQFRREINRDEAIAPKPRLIQIEWDDEKAAHQVFWNAANTGRLALESQAKADVAAGGMEDYGPARHALVCALVGIQRRPWRPPQDSDSRDHVLDMTERAIWHPVP